MDEDLLNSIEDVNASVQPTPPVQSVSSAQPVSPTQPTSPALPSKSKNPKKFILTILALILIIGVIIAAVFITMNLTKGPDTNDEVAPLDDDKPVPEEEITDEEVINNIKSKLATIMGGEVKGNVIEVISDNYTDINVFSEVVLDSDIALSSAISSVKDQFRTLSEEEMSAVLEFLDEEEVDTDSIRGVSGEVVASAFHRLYGVDLNKALLPRYYYTYLPDYDLYVSVDDSYIIQPYKRYYYLNKYTIATNQVRIYLNGAMYDTSTGKVYCDSNLEATDVCTELSEGQEFTLTEENRENYTEKTFNFIKGEDDYYYGDIYMIQIEE